MVCHSFHLSRTIILALALSCLIPTGCLPADESRGSNSDSDADSDTDTDTETDTYDIFDCDCPSPVGTEEQKMVGAITICMGQEVFTVERIFTSDNGHLGFSVLDSMGTNDCLLPRHGCQMITLGTGPVAQANPNDAVDMGDHDAQTDLDPMPEYQGYSLNADTPEAACDVSQLKFGLTAPSTALGFSFDFLFGSAEYDEWMNQGYNDTFYAIMESSELNSGATTNIAFDDNGCEIEVDTNFFENDDHPCDESGSGWDPSMEDVSGSTGWLRTSWPVSGGHQFDLTFSIHDEGDCIFDSIVFIDNFRWSVDPVVGGTVPIE